MAFDGSRVEYYRARARMIRVLAENCSIPKIKEECERIAEQYDQLAREVESGQISR